MPEIWVKVVRRNGGGIGRPFYLETDYDSAAGNVGTPITIMEEGDHLFETLDDDRVPNWRATANIQPEDGNSEDSPITVTLRPVAG